MDDNIPFRNVLKFKYSNEKFSLRSNERTLVVQVHGPRVDLSSVNVREERREQNVNEQDLRDGLGQVVPDGVDDVRGRVLLVDFKEKEKQPEQLRHRKQPPHFDHVDAPCGQFLFDEEVGLVRVENNEQGNCDDQDR